MFEDSGGRADRLRDATGRPIGWTLRCRAEAARRRDSTSTRRGSRPGLLPQPGQTIRPLRKPLERKRARLAVLALCALGATAMLAGCAQLGELGDTVSSSVQKALERNLKAGTGGPAAGDPPLPDGYVAFWDSEIKDFFVRNPRTSAATTFPRVAVTMEEAPSWHLRWAPPGMETPPATGCWRFRAMVWTDAKTSRALKPFHLCNYDRSGRVFAVDRQGFEIWGGAHVRGSLIPSSGDVRTEGPDRPFTAIPNSIHPFSFSWGALAAVTGASGLSVTDGDPRLWFNVDPKLGK